MTGVNFTLINKSDTFIFDVFYKDNKIYLLLPETCVENIDISKLILSVDCKEIQPSLLLKKENIK